MYISSNPLRCVQAYLRPLFSDMKIGNAQGTLYLGYQLNIRKATTDIAEDNLAQELNPEGSPALSAPVVEGEHGVVHARQGLLAPRECFLSINLEPRPPQGLRI